MIALPKISGTPSQWRMRVIEKERHKQNADYENHCYVIAIAKQLRAELRQERKERRAA